MDPAIVTSRSAEPRPSIAYRRLRAARRSTVLVRAPETFQNKVLWPEFQALREELNAELEKLTERVIREAIDEDVSEKPALAPACGLLLALFADLEAVMESDPVLARDQLRALFEGARLRLEPQPIAPTSRPAGSTSARP